MTDRPGSVSGDRAGRVRASIGRAAERRTGQEAEAAPDGRPAPARNSGPEVPDQPEELRSGVANVRPGWAERNASLHRDRCGEATQVTTRIRVVTRRGPGCGVHKWVERGAHEWVHYTP